MMRETDFLRFSQRVHEEAGGSMKMRGSLRGSTASRASGREEWALSDEFGARDPFPQLKDEHEVRRVSLSVFEP